MFFWDILCQTWNKYIQLNRLYLWCTEAARKSKDLSKISTLSREWLHGSKSRPMFGCTLWYCSDKCNQFWYYNLGISLIFEHLVFYILKIFNIGTWYGEKALYHWVLPFHWDAKWCCWRHCFRAWWRGMCAIFVLNHIGG